MTLNAKNAETVRLAFDSFVKFEFFTRGMLEADENFYKDSGCNAVSISHITDFSR